MESLNSIQSNEKLSNLMDKINETCDALISALEVNAQSVGEYGGWVAHQINTEYVDILIKNILKIKYHLLRLEKELNNGLVTSRDELKYIVIKIYCGRIIRYSWRYRYSLRKWWIS